MQSTAASADTGAASAALARPPIPERIIDRILLVDDSDEDVTQIITVLTERSLAAHHTFKEVQS